MSVDPSRKLAPFRAAQLDPAGISTCPSFKLSWLHCISLFAKTNSWALSSSSYATRITLRRCALIRADLVPSDGDSRVGHGRDIKWTSFRSGGEVHIFVVHAERVWMVLMLILLALLPSRASRPSTASPRMTDEETADMLNERFRSGRPSNHPAQAGVFVSQPDGIRDPARPWLPCSAGSACAASGFGDRLSGSVINTRLPKVFSKSRGGLVLSPRVVRVHCACEALSMLPCANLP